MTTFIENAATLADIAKATKGTVAQVEADAGELSLFIGCDWAGKPALSVIDAARMVSGDARRDAEHAEAHRRWRADSEDWELQREQVRQQAFNDHFDAVRRRGVGDPQAAHGAAQAGSAAIVAYEKVTPAPTFGDAETSRLSTTRKMTNRIKEKVR